MMLDIRSCVLFGNNDDLHELWGKAHGPSSDKAQKIIMVALMAYIRITCPLRWDCTMCVLTQCQPLLSLLPKMTEFIWYGSAPTAWAWMLLTCSQCVITHCIVLWRFLFGPWAHLLLPRYSDISEYFIKTSVKKNSSYMSVKVIFKCNFRDKPNSLYM